MNTKPMFDMKACPDWIGAGASQWFHGGSRVMCNPAPTDTDDDYDYVFLMPSNDALQTLNSELSKDWTLGGSKAIHNQGNNIFYSWKKNELNVIVTANYEWFNKMYCATKVCAVLNEPSKERRVMIFKAIVYGEGP